MNNPSKEVDNGVGPGRYVDFEEEFEYGCQQLSDLQYRGVITEEEKCRRQNLIMEYLEVEDAVHDELQAQARSKRDSFPSVISNMSYNIAFTFVDCLRDCFVGRYEVD